ncbi:MAG: hypothetical protein V3U68_04910 [Bacteroidota bacterium]
MQSAAEFWGSRSLAKKKLYVLQKKGWVARIERGKYIVIPFEAGPERKWSEDSYFVASTLVRPGAIAYWSAIRHWNWTEQIPRIVYVQSTKRKSTPRRTVFGVEYEIVTVSKRKFFGHDRHWRRGTQFLVTDKEKTLIDCADDVERSGSIEELAKAVEHGSKEISWNTLNEYAERFPNGAVKKRLGYLFENLVPTLPAEARAILDHWRQTLTAGVSPMQVTGARKGKISTRWRLLVNAEL